jgi:hypothetical protein
MRRIAIVLTAATLLAGCGGNASPTPGPAAAVSGTVDLTRATAGAPDAGTRAGHGNDVVNATTAADVFSFTGRVDPPDSAVRVSDGVVRMEPSGRFTVATTAPARGTKRLRLDATLAGHRPWSLEVRLSRGEPQRVEVPEQDDVAPSAALALRNGEEVVVQPSPSRAGERADVVRLSEPRFEAIAAVRDSTGGTGRIRISIRRVDRCGGTARESAQSIPPAQIVDIALPPGAQAPVERQRARQIDLRPKASCTVRGEVLAEGTDAHGRQAVTAHIGFAYP